MIVSMFAQEAIVADLWRLDTLSITDSVQKRTKNVLQAEVKERFRQTIRIDEEDRYEVSLPWKDEHPELADNKNAAQSRLESLTKKLRKQGLYENYQEVFDEWLSEGIIEKVPDEEIQQYSYYLPHRHVIKADSTTKIKPVFDASAVGNNGISLNLCLETGLNLIELIPNILLRFRWQKIGIISDIRKAFLQISIVPEDRDVLRFLWWNKTRPERLEIYRHRSLWRVQ